MSLVCLLWKGKLLNYYQRVDSRTGVRDAVNWLYARVQNARKM